MLGLPVWAIVLIVSALSILPIPFASELYWLVGLIGAICGPQDGFAITYYILTVLPVFTTIMNVIALKNNRQ